MVVRVVAVRNEVGDGSVRVGRGGQDGESVVVVVVSLEKDVLEDHRRGGQRSALVATTAGR